ncbi:uncharacterized protein LOC121092466 isoform X8 [Falco naumanni]|uniref:uncharacterized protein LOC121092466 isoform X8 n=1 Tax=Falco naumanni TaxID=148594 RepID=UPI001ADEAAFF|nr:uncharacterized protein LOC121092466 isoform X8 [Falco naumanni]
MAFNGKYAARFSLGTAASSFQLFQSPPRAASDVPRALQLRNSSSLLRGPDVTRFFSLISRCSDHLVQLVSLSRHICEKCRELRVVQWKFLRFLVRQTHKELGLGQRRRQEFGRYLFCRNKSFLLILSSLHLQEGYSTHGWGLANGSWTSPCHAQHSQLEPTLPMHATTCHAGDALPCFQTSRLWKTVEWQLMETRTSFSCRLLRLRSNRDKGFTLWEMQLPWASRASTRRMQILLLHIDVFSQHFCGHVYCF